MAFKMIAAALPGEKGPTFFSIGKALPTAPNPNTRIERIIPIGDAHDVFVRETLEGNRGQVGSWMRLPAGSVQFLIESAERDEWDKESGAVPGHDFGELTDPYGRSWALNAATPGAPGSITRIVMDLSGMATVYALPDPGTPAAQKNLGFRFTFPAGTGFVCMTQGMPITEWLDQIAFIESEAAADDDEPPPPGAETTAPAGEEAIDDVGAAATANGASEVAPS